MSFRENAMNKENVLIIEDNPMTRDILRQLLEASDFIAHCFESGTEALDMIKENTIRKFVVDYRLPHTNGDEIVRQIRETSSEAYIIGYSTEDKEEAFLRAGADVFIRKEDMIRKMVPAMRGC
jgi:DNA-binding response OmpR family regulator